MISEQQIRSLIRMQSTDQEEQTQHLLDLSHKELRKLKQIDLTELKVQRVDASYNYFKDFNHLNFKQINDQLDIPIKWLDVSFNFFTRIDESAESAHVLQFLKYLNISANRLESVDFSRLSVPLLEVLNLNNNQLQFFLDCPTSLKIVNLDHNQLSSLAFSGGENLSILSARLNLKNLLLFDLQSNLVDDLQAVKQFVLHSKQLLSINLRENPVSSINNYRVMLLQNCGNITQIDEVIISPHIREGFKILKTQEKLDQMLDEANKKYVDRLSQKQKMKEQLIKKMKEQEVMIEERFNEGIKEQKDQFEVLQKKAKQILGKNKMNVENEKKQFNQKLLEYNGELEHLSEENQQKINEVQNQHLKDYLEYLKKRPTYPQSGQMRMRTQKRQLSEVNIRPEFQNIILFDTKCVSTLLKSYHVNLIEF